MFNGNVWEKTAKNTNVQCSCKKHLEKSNFVCFYPEGVMKTRAKQIGGCGNSRWNVPFYFKPCDIIASSPPDDVGWSIQY